MSWLMPTQCTVATPASSYAGLVTDSRGHVTADNHSSTATYLRHSRSGFRQSKPLTLVALSYLIVLLLLLLKARLGSSQSCRIFCCLQSIAQKDTEQSHCSAFQLYYAPDEIASAILGPNIHNGEEEGDEQHKLWPANKIDGLCHSSMATMVMA